MMRPIVRPSDSRARPRDIRSRSRFAWLLCFAIAAGTIVSTIAYALPRGHRVAHEQTTQTTVITGVVVDSALRPLQNVEVVVTGLSITARTNAQGRYRLTDVPKGTHMLTVRLVGYAAISAAVTVAGEAEITKDFSLRPSQTVLDSVAVRAKMNDPRMDEFEEHRKLRLGHFLTREDLAKNEGRRMSDLLSMIPGLGIVQGRAGRGFILSKRYIIPLSELKDSCDPNKPSPPGAKLFRPTRMEAQEGKICGCYAQVYLDGSLMNPGQPTDPFDVNTISTTQLEGIEYYASPAETPAKYSRLNSPCGVYVMHTRRQG
jgi:hypothetical protein